MFIMLIMPSIVNNTVLICKGNIFSMNGRRKKNFTDNSWTDKEEHNLIIS